jgi:hypothetical protein
MILTFRLFGIGFGAARLLVIIAFGVIIGTVMSTIFHEQSDGTLAKVAVPENEIGKRWWVQAIFFGLLVAIMVVALDSKWLAVGILLAMFVPFFAISFSQDELRSWFEATYLFVRSILPWIVIGSLGAAAIAGLIPSGLVSDLAGGNSPLASLTTAFLGSLMYLCPPAEVLVTKAFTQLGMGMGPALAFILTGPAVSLPSIIVLVRVIGWRKSLTYVLMLFTLATAAGYIFGLIFT